MRHYLSFIILLSCFAFLSVANAVETGVVDFQQEGTEIRLQVSQVPLSMVLNEISAKTGLIVHYSILPEKPVTATCVGQSIKSVLDCLFAGTIDMVFRYPKNMTDLSIKRPIEVWLLGSSLATNAVAVKECAQSELVPNQAQAQAIEKPNVDQQPKSSLEEALEFRMQMVVSDNALHRSQAISYLAEHAELDNEVFNKILDDALTDNDAEVRGQAIFALVRRQGEVNSLSELQQAFLDDDVSVRMMALQQVNETTVLIQQALNDENDSIRQFATMKLQTE